MNMGQAFPKSGLTDYHLTLRNTQEERRPHLHRGGCLKSLFLGCPVGKNWSDRISNYLHWLRLPQLPWSLKFSSAQCIKKQERNRLIFSMVKWRT